MSTRCSGTRLDGNPCRNKVAGSDTCGKCKGKATPAATPTTADHDGCAAVADEDPLAAGTPATPADEALTRISGYVDTYVPIKAQVEVDPAWRIPCTKCGGTGEYAHYGTCSACRGRKTILSPEGRKKYRALKAAGKDGARDKHLAGFAADPDMAVAIDKVLADAIAHTPEGCHPEIAQQVADVHYPAFTHDISFKALHSGRWTGPQRDALVRAVDQTDTPKEPGAPAPAGKVETSMKVVKAEYRPGYQGATVGKMLLEHEDGWRAWVTVPHDLEVATGYDIEMLKGTQLHLKVTLEPKDDDPSFAIGKRPKLIGQPAWKERQVHNPVLAGWADAEGHDPDRVAHVWHELGERHPHSHEPWRVAMTRAIVTEDNEALTELAP